MNTAVSALSSLAAFLVVVMVCVLVHEGGHYLAARLCGVGVREFAAGMGPRLWSRTGARGTVFSVRAIPVGGFVSLDGLDDGEPKDPSLSYWNKGPVRRLFILCAGVAMNMLLAYLIFSAVAAGQGIPDASPTVGLVEAGSTAERIGMLPGDRIVSVGGVPVGNFEDVRNAVLASGGGSAEIIFERVGEESVTVRGADLGTAERPRLGVTASIRTPGLVEAFRYGAEDFARIMKMALNGLAAIFFRFRMEDLAGPVGLAAASGMAASMGLWPFIYFLGLVSLNIGLLNALPIMPLDGGRVMLTLVEAVINRGRRLSIAVEAALVRAGAGIILCLLAAAVFRDLVFLAS